MRLCGEVVGTKPLASRDFSLPFHVVLLGLGGVLPWGFFGRVGITIHYLSDTDKLYFLVFVSVLCLVCKHLASLLCLNLLELMSL